MAFSLFLPRTPSAVPSRKPHWISIVCTRTFSLPKAMALSGEGVVSVLMSEKSRRCVSGSATPVRSRPLSFWNCSMAVSVFSPYTPSAESFRKPSAISRILQIDDICRRVSLVPVAQLKRGIIRDGIVVRQLVHIRVGCVRSGAVISPVPPPKIISSAVVASAVWNGVSTPIDSQHERQNKAHTTPKQVLIHLNAQNNLYSFDALVIHDFVPQCTREFLL